MKKSYLLIILIITGFHSFLSSQVPGLKTSVARKTVLFEIGTSVGCANCTSVTEAMDSLIINGKDVSIIKYQFADEFESQDGYQRVQYYGITANPTIMIDGKERIVGGGYQLNLYPEYLEKYEQYISAESYIDIDMEVSLQEEGIYQLQVDVKQLEEVYDTKLFLRIALIESHIPHDWFYLNEVNFVCRDMLPSDKGYQIKFDEDSLFSVEMAYELDTLFNVKNCDLIAFVQHDGSMEVMQAVKSELPFQETQVVDKAINQTYVLYPNPVVDYITIGGSTAIDRIEILSADGKLLQTIGEEATKQRQFSVEELNKGLYFCVVYAKNTYSVLEFVRF